MTAHAGRLRPWRLARATPLAIWLLCGLQFLLAVWYALGVPLLHAPDEHAHVDRILTPGEPADLDPLEDDELSERTVAILPRVHLTPVDWRVAPYHPWDGLAEAEALPREARPAYTDLAPDRDSGLPNQVASHPPLYYLYEAGGLAVVRTLDAVASGDEPWPWDRTVTVLRLLSVLLIVPVPWLAYWTAVRLSGRSSVGALAAVIPLAAPQVSHIVGSVNNDGLLLLIGALVTAGAVWIATGDRSVRTAALTGGAAGLALLTKVFGLAAPLWVVAAYAVAWGRARSTEGPAARSTAGDVVRGLGAAAVTALVVGGWFVIRAVLRYGTPAPRGSGYPPVTIEPHVVFWLGELWSRLTRTFWGFFGVEQFAMPMWVVTLLSLFVLGAVVAAALGGRWEQRAGWRVADLVVLLLPAVTSLAMLLYAAWNGYLASGLPVGIHGRYLYSGLLGVSVAVALGVGALSRSRLVPGATAAVALAVHAVAAWTVVRSFWAGPDVVAQLGALVAWSPFRGRTVAVVWALLGITGVAALWRLATAPPLRSSPPGAAAATHEPSRGRSAPRRPPPA